MEKYYRLKCKQIENTPYYQITKNNFLCNDSKENYLFITKPKMDADSFYLFQKMDCFILNRNNIQKGDIMCIKNENRTSFFIFIDVFVEKTYKKPTIFLVGKGFPSKFDAIEFYNEHQEEIEDESLTIETEFKNGNTFTYIRDKFKFEENDNLADFYNLTKSDIPILY